MLIASETLLLNSSTVNGGSVRSSVYDTSTFTFPSSLTSTAISFRSTLVSLLTLSLIISTSTKSTSVPTENSNETIFLSDDSVGSVVGSSVKVDTSSNTFCSLSSVSIILFCNVSASKSGMLVPILCLTDTITLSASNVIVISSSGFSLKYSVILVLISSLFSSLCVSIYGNVSFNSVTDLTSDVTVVGAIGVISSVCSVFLISVIRLFFNDGWLSIISAITAVFCVVIVVFISICCCSP